MQAVSIVIPCHNHGKYLLETINSLYLQTYKNFEIIIVDDGSNDEFTKSVLKNFENQGHTVITQLNKGPAAARNAGIKHSKGEYILALDADDTLEPTFIEKTMNLFSTGTEIIGASSWVNQFGANKGIVTCKGGSIKNFVGDCPVVVSAIFMKHRWTEIGGYDEQMLLGYEDWEFWIRYLIPGGVIAIVPEPLFNYRVKPGSRVDQSKLHRVEIMDYMVRKNHIIYEKYAVDAILGCEKYVDYIEKKYTSEIENIYNCLTFKTGELVLLPVKLMKKLLKNLKIYVLLGN